MKPEKIKLKEIDDKTAEKLSADYPPDWEMDELFDKSYSKFMKLKNEKPESFDASEEDILEFDQAEVIERKHRIRLFSVNRFAAVACFVLLALLTISLYMIPDRTDNNVINEPPVVSKDNGTSQPADTVLTQNGKTRATTSCSSAKKAENTTVTSSAEIIIVLPYEIQPDIIEIINEQTIAPENTATATTTETTVSTAQEYSTKVTEKNMQTTYKAETTFARQTTFLTEKTDAVTTVSSLRKTNETGSIKTTAENISTKAVTSITDSTTVQTTLEMTDLTQTSSDSTTKPTDPETTNTTQTTSAETVTDTPITTTSEPIVYGHFQINEGGYTDNSGTYGFDEITYIRNENIVVTERDHQAEIEGFTVESETSQKKGYSEIKIKETETEQIYTITQFDYDMFRLGVNPDLDYNINYLEISGRPAFWETTIDDPEFVGFLVWDDGCHICMLIIQQKYYDKAIYIAENY